MASEMKQLSTWVPEEVAKEIERLAAIDRRTISMWLRMLAEEKIASASKAAA